eukprot:IDg19079t1
MIRRPQQDQVHWTRSNANALSLWRATGPEVNVLAARSMDLAMCLWRGFFFDAIASSAPINCAINLRDPPCSYALTRRIAVEADPNIRLSFFYKVANCTSFTRCARLSRQAARFAG